MDDKELYCTVLECSGFLFIFKSEICIQKLEGEWLYTSTAATLFCWCDISPIQEENLKKKKKVLLLKNSRLQILCSLLPVLLFQSTEIFSLH